MKKQIYWHLNSKISEESIREIEQKWKVKLPKEYVDIVKEHDGSIAYVIYEDGSKEQGSIDIEKWSGRTATFSLEEFKEFPNLKVKQIDHFYESLKDCLPDPKKIFPFASDAGGNIFLFDYRDNEKEPKIIFLDHEELITIDELDEDEIEEKPLSEWQEETLYFVANSFNELLEKIY